MSRPTAPRRSVILDTVLDVVTRTALLFSVFLLFVGHNAPGGGFVGGLVAATALVLRYTAGGADRVDDVAAVHEATLLGSGLLLAAVTGMAGWLWGGAFLDQVEFEFHVPVLGEVHGTSALPFDIGVYLVVVGLGLALLRSLGAAADREAHDEGAMRREVVR